MNIIYDLFICEKLFTINMNTLQDTPLKELAEDKFGRDNLVQLIVDSISYLVKSSHPCTVYGVYGIGKKV